MGGAKPPSPLPTLRVSGRKTRRSLYPERHLYDRGNPFYGNASNAVKKCHTDSFGPKLTQRNLICLLRFNTRWPTTMPTPFRTNENKAVQSKDMPTNKLVRPSSLQIWDSAGNNFPLTSDSENVMRWPKPSATLGKPQETDIGLMARHYPKFQLSNNQYTKIGPCIVFFQTHCSCLTQRPSLFFP